MTNDLHRELQSSNPYIASHSLCENGEFASSAPLRFCTTPSVFAAAHFVHCIGFCGIVILCADHFERNKVWYNVHMAIEFSKDQLKAIETVDRSVLVSAAAGSGKTAVLVERILRIILDGKADVDEMLVVTFTRAAASEMKQRLSSAIRKRIKEHPEDAERLSEQLSKLYRAYITTIDSFAMRVIREFFYEIDIEPDFGACDEVQGELMRREALQEMLDAGFEDDMFLSRSSGEDADEADRVGFREFMRLYSEERQEDSFRTNLLKAYDGLRSIPDYISWAYSKAEMLRITPEAFDGSMLREVILGDADETFARAEEGVRKLRELLEDAGISEMFEVVFAPEADAIHEIAEELAGGRLDENLLARIAGIEYKRISTRKDWKESYDAVKDDVKAVREAYKKEINEFNSKYYLPDFEVRLREMNETYRYVVYFIRLLEEFDQRYAAKKKERRVMDFPDMEHNAVRILRRGETADILRRRFRYIFVDEYQDTNRIQETLISSFARPDNVFRVGDIKQSIYRFRQAEPSIFEDLYRRFSDKDSAEGLAIDLSMNYRSNDATINYINRVFEEIMPGYDERARLNAGVRCPEEYDFIPEVHVLTEDGGDEDAQPAEGSDPGVSAEADDGIDEEIESLSKEEAEADHIAQIAADLIGKEFYDTKQQVVRTVRARDIVILYRAAKVRGDIMARALRSHAIEPYVEETDDYFDTVEIGIALSLLTCIDNMKRDIPLIASLHSAAFGWSPSELAEVRIAHTEHRRSAGSGEKHGSRSAYWEALQWYTEEGPDEDLRQKAQYAADRLLWWRRLSRMMPLDDFVWKVLIDSGCYRMAGAMNGGSRRQANLRALADRAGRFSRDNVASLSSFIAFVEVMKKKKINNGQTPAAGPGEDVIRITTIHKSKGLEYPFVIVGGLGHRIRYDSIEKAFSFDTDIGVSLPYVDPSRRYWRSTAVQRAINAKSRRDEYSEELRILYVAMTRARNKLILVGSCPDEKSLDKYTSRPVSLLKVLRSVMKTGFNTYHIEPLGQSAAREKYRKRSVPDPAEIELTEEEKLIYDEIDRRFTYRYPHAELLSAKAKYSVSALRREALEGRTDTQPEETETQDAEAGSVRTADDEVVQLWTAGEKRRKASAADTGIAYHRIMEFLDFAKALPEDGAVDEEYIRTQAAKLRKNGAIESDVYDALDLSRIDGFFRIDIGRRAADAARRGALLKEKAFTLKPEREGRKILVQGVIDCCFEENGKMVLIDYKSSFIKPGRDRAAEHRRIRDEYAVQIDLYREALYKGTGKETGEAYLYLFMTGEALDMI